MTDAKQIKKSVKKANDSLADLGRAYHQGIPLTDIASILDRNGFDSGSIEGIYTGREGRSHDHVGSNVYLSLTWYKLENSGRMEVVAYLSK